MMKKKEPTLLLNWFEEILSKDFPLTKLAREVLFDDDSDKVWFEE